jgi:hypothetical protein
MIYVALISDQFIKENTYLNNNIDPQVIRPVVRLAQEMYILPLLGTALYNKVMGLVSGSPTVTLSGDYGTLLHQYIQPTELWYLISEATVPIAYRYVDKNVVRKTSDNSTPADLNEIRALKDDAKNKAEMYADRLYRYLQTNQNLYPEFTNPGTSFDTIFPKRRNFSGMMVMGNTRTRSSLTNGQWGDLTIGYPDWYYRNGNNE